MITANIIVGSPTIGAPTIVAMHRGAMRLARQRHNEQRSNACRRHVPWQINFVPWISIWWISGHWRERGKCKGQFVMARRGDTGPYREDNVVIITNAANVVEAFGGKPISEEVRRLLSESAKQRGEAGWRAAVTARIGTHHSPEARARMSAAQFARRARERAERAVSS
jgi:hypothetical protein